MAIAFDVSSKIAAAATATPASWSHTCTGSNRALIVTLENKLGTENITAVTYAGAAMTKLTGASRLDTTNLINLSYWTLLNPATGANTISVTWTVTTQRLLGLAVSFTGVASIEASANAAGTNSGGVPQPATSVTTLANNAWTIGAAAVNDNTPLAAGTSQTLATQFNDTVSPFHTVVLDYRGPVTPAASTTNNFTGTVSGDSWLAGVASLAPSVTSTDHNLTLLGIGS